MGQTVFESGVVVNEHVNVGATDIILSRSQLNLDDRVAEVENYEGNSLLQPNLGLGAEPVDNHKDFLNVELDQLSNNQLAWTE